MNTPILLITFNRPDHTRKVLECIMAQHPKDLYVFQDGARDGNSKDVEKCKDVRVVIDNLTKDTDTTLHTNYSNVNLGCGLGPITGFKWFFDNVEMGIVMEDDCLAHPDFFRYCEEMLLRYKDEQNVKFVCSTLYDNKWRCKDSYDFSHYMVAGAWAGWKRTMDGYDIDLKQINPSKIQKKIKMLTNNKVESNWWYFLSKEIQQDKKKKSYWDYQMQLHLFNVEALTIHPKCNLISNIGFDSEGTHTMCNDGRGDKPTYPIMPLSHPSFIKVDKERDKICWSKAQSKGWFNDKINYLYNSLLWSNGFGHKILMLYKKLRGKGVNSNKV